MVDWKLYIDSHQKRALDLCGGSLTEGDGCGWGYGYGDGNGDGDSFDYGNCFGAGYGGGRGGGSSTKW